MEVEGEIDEAGIIDAYKLDDLDSLCFSLEQARQRVQIARSDVQSAMEVVFCPAGVRVQASTLMDDLDDMETQLAGMKNVCEKRRKAIKEKEDG